MSVASTASIASDANDLKKILHDTKVDGGSKSVWAMTLETFGMSDGKKKQDDIVCEGFDEAYTQLQGLAADKQFSYTPFADFGATREDLLKAFVHWSRKGDDDDKRYNPSKAFRRLEEYEEWMAKNCEGMDLKGSTLGHVASNWKMLITHDANQRLVWWMDFDSIDLKQIKKTISDDDTLRYFVWLAHLVLFDKAAQENGLVFVQAIGNTGMMELMTGVSMDVSTKLDRLTIGTLPIKMDAFILYNNPGWIRIMMALMSPFIGKKMKKRVVSVPNNEAPQEFFDACVGRNNIPKGLSKLEGTVEMDVIAETLERLGSKQ